MIKKKVILLCGIFLFSFTNYIAFYSIDENLIEIPYQEEKSPQLNNQNINIITPENKTYSKPMSGYYPGTYGFENDIVGELPSFAENYLLDGGTIKIIEEMDGHKKIIELYDNNITESIRIVNSFSSSFGAIEFWIRMNDTSKGFWIDLTGNTVTYPTAFLRILIQNRVWRYTDYTTAKNIPNVPIPQNNTWHRITIHFRCNGAPPYKGLNNNKWKCIIDGIDSGELSPRGPDESYVINLNWNTLSGFGDFLIYLDAIGYSWDPKYNIGDNIDEGLLLSFENNMNLNEIEYSLDDQEGKSILGNTAIPIPEDGIHSIQVSGEDPDGIWYKSDIRYFTINFSIDIITPEAKTYSLPMNGYYPATIGFEDQEEGTLPYGWNIMYGSNNNISIINEFDDHKKVLILNDTSPLEKIEVNKTFETQKFGTIEFWWAISNTNNFVQIALFNSTTGLASISIDWKGWLNKWEYYDGVGFPDLPNIKPPPKNNTFYHLRIDFERTTGGYQSLGQNKFRVIFNGDSSGELDLGQNNDIDVLTIYSWVGSFNYSNYFDAIGYSWDPNYNIGDNLNEGLLLSFVNNTKLDWMGYTLDGSANRTIGGNTTIPLPYDGSHVIRVFGNDTSVTFYESNIRHFSVHHINIDTPEDIIYTATMSGYYPATYGFEDQEDGSFPNGWIDQTTGNPKVSVIANKAGHEKVLRSYDDDGGVATVMQNFTEQTEGTIEFWIYKDAGGTGSPANIQLKRNITSSWTIALLVDDSNSNGGENFWDPSYGGEIGSYSDDQWFHIRFDFNCSSQKYNTYIDGIKEVDQQDFATPFPSIGCFYMSSSAGRLGTYYFDALGYSWDPNYNIGDNLKEGLLVSFENATALNWTGYSLDYQSIISIMGNITIIMPSEGFHTIQVFGNNSMGTFYQSEVRNFAVFYDLTAPDIIINLPSSNSLFGSSAPEFNVTVIEQNLQKMWYTIDAGLTNITITEPTGMINQLKWDDRPNGTLDIRFYARDIIGHIGFEEISVKKDVLPPDITINSPSQSQIFRDNSPVFNITINEGNLDEIWYTLDDGLVNITCGTSGQIIQQYWNALRPGDYILKFYANDTLGNLGFSEVSIKKREQVISVYNPIIISLISITGIAVIIHKIKKKLE